MVDFEPKNGWYSMIFLYCNKRSGHYAKTRQASLILKEAPGRWEFAVLCWKISRIFCKKNDHSDTCATVNEILQTWKLGKIVMTLAELFFFKLLLFLNDLSYRCQIGLKWKIFWSSFWLKLDRHTYFKSWMHLVNWKSILQKKFPEKN